MGRRKQKKEPTGKDILAMKVGQKFAESVIKSLREYATKLIPKDVEGVPAIIINEDTGVFAIISDETAEILETILTPVDIIKQIAGDDNDIAWRLWNSLLKYSNKFIKEKQKNFYMALLFRQNCHNGKFILIESDLSNNFNFID